MGTYVYFGVADYVDNCWIHPVAKVPVFQLYKELVKFQEVSDYDLHEMPAPSNWVPSYA